WWEMLEPKRSKPPCTRDALIVANAGCSRVWRAPQGPSSVVVMVGCLIWLLMRLRPDGLPRLQDSVALAKLKGPATAAQLAAVAHDKDSLELMLASLFPWTPSSA